MNCKWLNIYWWVYLLQQKAEDVSWFKTIKCRIKGHKCGVVWFNNGTDIEPDMHCRNCGDDLG